MPNEDAPGSGPRDRDPSKPVASAPDKQTIDELVTFIGHEPQRLSALLAQQTVVLLERGVEWKDAVQKVFLWAKTLGADWAEIQLKRVSAVHGAREESFVLGDPPKRTGKSFGFITFGEEHFGRLLPGPSEEFARKTPFGPTQVFVTAGTRTISESSPEKAIDLRNAIESGLSNTRITNAASVFEALRKLRQRRRKQVAISAVVAADGATFSKSVAAALKGRAWVIDDFVTAPFRIDVKLPEGVTARALVDDLARERYELNLDISEYVQPDVDPEQIAFLALYESGQTRTLIAELDREDSHFVLRLFNPLSLVDPHDLDDPFALVQPTPIYVVGVEVH
jgi:hypothetical protein